MECPADSTVDIVRRRPHTRRESLHLGVVRLPTLAGGVLGGRAVDRYGGRPLILTDVTVRTTTPGLGRVGIEVTGRALTIVPGLPGLAVTQRAEGPVERFTTAGAP